MSAEFDDSRGEPLVVARGLVKRFRRRGGLFGRPGPEVRAVNGVDIDVSSGETLGLVGESGSGKSTLGRLLIRLIDPDDGSIRFDGEDLLALGGEALRRRRREFQIVFQDPYASLNPRMRVGSAIGEPLIVHRLVSSRVERRERVAQLMSQVGLDPVRMDDYPSEFSGGQRQRIGIARAIACSPRFIVADEPIAALDPPVRAGIVNLLVDLQERLGLAYLFIAHDLRIVRHFCDRVAVMYLGRIVEQAPAETLFAEPLHPYTQALLASTPSTVPGDVTPPALVGEPPSPSQLPAGCAFHPRCPIAEPECALAVPPLLEVRPGHKVACRRVP